MRTLTLFLAALFLTLSPLAAADNSQSNIGIYNGNGEMFTFVERGITFSIFQNGEFDFYINPRQGGLVHAGVNLGGVSISYNAGYDYDAFVQYDDYGAIVQIEDVPIFYDHYGRISQAGDVRIRYNNNRLFRVGGLYIHYNRFGVYSHYTGFINRWNRFYSYHPYHDFFVRPVFNRCIVSLRPYRRWYNPVRYTYFRGRGYDRGYRYRNYRRAGRSFRPIDARVRTSNEGRRVARRYNDVRRSNDRVARRNGEVRRNEGVRRSTVERSVQRDRSRVSERRAEGVRRTTERIAERRSNELRRPQSTRSHQDRTVRRRSTTPRTSEQRSTVQRSKPRVQQERRRVERRTTTPQVRQQRATQSRAQARKAPQRSSVQKPRTRVQSSRKQQVVRKKSSSNSKQRNGNRRVTSKRRG